MAISFRSMMTTEWKLLLEWRRSSASFRCADYSHNAGAVPAHCELPIHFGR
jgi:hypothetical protein